MFFFLSLLQGFHSLLKVEIPSLRVWLKKEGIPWVKLVREGRYCLGQQKNKLRFNSASMNAQLSKLEQSCKNMTEQETQGFFTQSLLN